MRRPLVFVLAGIFASMGASFRTTNFVVEAATPQIAQQVGQYAEQYRREKALEWTGREMQPWPKPCPIRVTVQMGGAGGATSFAFGNNQVIDQQMHIEGSLERLLNSVLPHEVTHTVFAHYFRCPLPRWADEGGAVLSEDEVERNRHDMMVRQILNTPGRAIPLRRLFALRDYPGDVMALYAQGFSVANFLVGNSNRATFLAFVGQGMSQQGWDAAVQTCYKYRSVEELEQAWLTHLRNTRKQPAQLAKNTTPPATPGTSQVVVRQTVPPTQPTLAPPGPIVRGQNPGVDTENHSAASSVSGPAGRPTYLPPANPPPGLVQAPVPPPPTPMRPTTSWQPAPATAEPAPVQLGPPQFDLPPPPGYPPRYSPVGYPN
jgi:hypothetical protein